MQCLVCDEEAVRAKFNFCHVDPLFVAELRHTSRSYILVPKDMIIGQDVYFLGYPFFDNPIKYLPEDINNKYPLPFVKKGIISKAESRVFFIDGHNNFGFSGGPVIFWNHQNKCHQILGVISSYLTHSGEVKLQPTASEKLFYLENSGIALAYDVKYAVDIIKDKMGVDTSSGFSS